MICIGSKLKFDYISLLHHTQVYYIVPAFIVGLMVGVFLWALYILLYKTRTRYFPSTTRTTTASENNNTEMKRSNQISFEDVSSQATVRSIHTLNTKIKNITNIHHSWLNSFATCYVYLLYSSRNFQIL